MAKCLVCGREIKANVCEYDKFENLAYFDEKPPAELVKRADDYAQKLLEGISDFSIKSFTATRDEQKAMISFSDIEQEKLFDKIDSFDKINWSDTEFAVYRDESNPDYASDSKKLKVLYKLNGVDKFVIVDINTAKCKDIIYLGIKINRDLTITVHIKGKSENIFDSKPIALELYTK